MTEKELMEKIINTVLFESNITRKEFFTSSRERPLVNARKIIALLAQRLNPNITLQGIDYYVRGKKDHTTVINWIQQGREHLKNEAQFKGTYEKCFKILNSKKQMVAGFSVLSSAQLESIIKP